MNIDIRPLTKELKDDYSNTDYDYIEAYPRKGDLSGEGKFNGPIELYKKYDFKLHNEHDNYYVMRRGL